MVQFSRNSQSDSEQLDPKLVHSCVPNKSDIDFKETWKICRQIMPDSKVQYKEINLAVSIDS